MYNPKEARLRKAMREQTRELSRSTTTTTPSSSTTNINSSSSNPSSSSTSSILGGSTTSAAVAAAAMSPLPGAASAANRIIAGPWFPLGGAPPPATHPKPILSPRVRPIDNTHTHTHTHTRVYTAALPRPYVEQRPPPGCHVTARLIYLRKRARAARNSAGRGREMRWWGLEWGEGGRVWRV